MATSKEKLAKAVIRKYKPEDRTIVRMICYNTGLMGKSIDPYFGCLDLFADYWMNYYTECEPESAYVAELDGRVVGYLVGCKDTSVQQEKQNTVIMPKIRRKLLMFGYNVDRRFFSLTLRYLRSIWRREFVNVSFSGYPAHLHMNLIEGCRSGGIGSKLLSAYLDYLRESNVSGLHLGTTSYNTLAVPFYRRWGFKLVSRHRLTLYEGIVPEKIDTLYFTREIP